MPSKITECLYNLNFFIILNLMLILCHLTKTFSLIWAIVIGGFSGGGTVKRGMNFSDLCLSPLSWCPPPSALSPAASAGSMSPTLV